MNIFKKGLVVGVLLSVLVVPSIGFANTNTSTISELQALINSLIKEVASLRAQLGGQSGGGSTQAWCYDFNNNLTIGGEGAEVRALQAALAREGFDVGKYRGYYGNKTASAVTGFQQKYKREVLTPAGLSYGTGFFGPSTIKKMNNLYGCANGGGSGGGGSTISTIKPSIKVLFPNGGENLKVGRTYPIRWNTTGYDRSEEVLITIVNTEGSENTPIVARTTNTGVYSWKVPGNLSEQFSDYYTLNNLKIRIYIGGVRAGEIGYGAKDSDYSDSVFSIGKTANTQTPSITILSPDGGELFNFQKNYQVLWNSEGVESVSIALYKNDAFFRWITANLNGETGSYQWSPSEVMSEADLRNDAYKVYIIGYKTSGGTVTDKSNSSFKIRKVSAAGSVDLAVRSIEVKDKSFRTQICNDGNETINGFRYDVSANGKSKTVDFNLSLYKGQCGGFTGMRLSDYGISSVWEGNVSVSVDPLNVIKESNESNNNLKKYIFVSDDESPQILLTAPNEGERWQIGDTHSILWTPYNPTTGVNPSTDVTAYLEKKVTGSFVTIGEMIPGGKASIHWSGEIDKFGKYAKPGIYYVRIVNNKTNKWDRSDRPIELVARGTLTADLKIGGSDDTAIVPAGGATYKISWKSNAKECEIINATSDGEYQKISGLKPSGNMSIDIVPGENELIVAGVYLRCSTKDGAGVQGSAGDKIRVLKAEVAQPAITVLSPNGGERLEIGKKYTIQWTVTGSDTISEKYPSVYNNGINITIFKERASTSDPIQFYKVANVPVGDGLRTYNWIIPTDIKTGKYNMEINFGGMEINDSSDLRFSIVSATSTNNLPDTTPPTISSIISSPSSNSATITWTTDEPSDSQVYYGLATTYGSATSLDTTLTTTHSQTITSLSPNITYNYKVKSTDASFNASISTNRTFTTFSTSNLPDLTVEIVAPDSTSFVSTICNIGSVAVSGFGYNISANGVSKTLTYAPSLAAGTCKPLNSWGYSYYGIPASGWRGDVTVSVDPTNLIQEYNETDNILKLNISNDVPIASASLGQMANTLDAAENILKRLLETLKK